MSAIGQDAREVLTILDSIPDEGAVVTDPRLRRALAPLRALRPKQIRCRRKHRHRTIAWCAIHPNEALLAFADSRRPQSVASRGLGGFYELHWDDDPAPVAAGFAPWIRMAQRSGRIRLAANPNVASGWPLRYTLVCLGCGDEHPLTNSRLLRLYAEAAEAQRDEIILLAHPVRRPPSA